MSRPLSERVRDWKWWLEQVAHFGVGGAIAYTFAFDFPWLIGFPASVLGGMIREIAQNVRFGPFRWDGSKADAAVDMAAWTMGAVIGSMIA